MSAIDAKPLSIRLPDSLRRSVEALAEREGISVEQFIASATSEKLAACASIDYLRTEAARAQAGALAHFLAAVPDNEPAPSDRMD